ncbi:SPOR domain-containing protein [Sphingopyxis indica]|uniref:SPOR domain-containing protein n=1 Tax=Sphingopyxis indica TaxID=436663 RepID=UPI0029391A28|nr:SPOR domain-containing protein [Sphingopyxis indica]WOF45339.1 SPOR domain-containing protein [Sphingopyxis indica]
MNRNLLTKIAVSGFVIGIAATGCSMNKIAMAPSDTLGKPQTASRSADRAREALEEGKVSKAVAHAEAAVSASPRDGHYRALLGQAYLGDGRFASAATALGEAMKLGAGDSNTVIALALANIAQGKPAAAVELLKSHSDIVPASDAGLALALAGDTQSAIYVLTGAARQPGADARTRQNLALAFALSGRWAQARVLASQDLPLDKLEGRMAEWSKLAGQPRPEMRVASLIGTEVRADSGMPVRLALSNFPADTQMAAAEAPVQVASADPAPVESFAPPPPVQLASAGDSAIRTVELPMPRRDASGVVPVTELPAPAPVIRAESENYRHAPRVAGANESALVARKASELAARITPQLFNAKAPSGWAVQLGAYDSLAVAKEKWGAIQKRNRTLAAFPGASYAADVKGRTFYRLTVNGLKSRADALSLCDELKAVGQACFVREMGGDEAIQWAAKAGPVRLASR